MVKLKFFFPSATLDNLKFGTDYERFDAYLRQTARKRIKLEPNDDLKASDIQPKICIQPVPHILRAANCNRVQRNRVRQRWKNRLPTMEARLESEKNKGKTI